MYKDKTMESGSYPISTVSELTGVNPVTLRAWERRYGLIQPERTESGHRMYSQADISRIRHILELLDQGMSIGRVQKALLNEFAETENQETGGPWVDYRDAMLYAVSRFDEAVLEDKYNEAMALYPVDVVTRQLLTPLLHDLGERWKNSGTGVAEEHFFSVFMRNKLGARFHHRNIQNDGPLLVAACLPNEQHEFGLLLFSLAAHARGYRLILLGANMPMSEIPKVVARTGADGVVLSGSLAMEPGPFAAEIADLVRDSRVPVFLGGHTTRYNAETIASSEVIPVGQDLSSGLHIIQQHLPANIKRKSTRG